MTHARFGFALTAVFVMVAAAAISAAAGPVQQLTACLKVVPGEPLGEAVYSWWDDDTRRLEVTVSGIAEGTYRIVIDCERLDAKLVVDATGEGSLRLDTRWGDTIPVVVDDSTICIKLDGVMVLSGKFR